MEETSNLYKIHDSDCSILYQIKVQNYTSAMRSRSITDSDKSGRLLNVHTTYTHASAHPHIHEKRHKTTRRRTGTLLQIYKLCNYIYSLFLEFST